MSYSPADRAALHAFLERKTHFLLTTHVNPDGDAIGSEVAFARWLRSRGKQVRILNDSPTPRAFAYLTEDDPVEVYDEALCETRFAEADALVVLDTGVKHDLAASEYNQRQAECAKVLEVMQARRSGIRALRDATEADLAGVAESCHAMGLRRCRHVLAENGRVHSAVEALGRADGRRLGELFAASHQSLRDDYQVSCVELDAMVEAALTAPGVVAARMTGGGFGGCTVNLVDRTKTDLFAGAALESYRIATGREGRALATCASDGVRAVDL